MINEGEARIIKDSCGNDTIEVSLKTDNGFFAASAPSGKSKGRYEAQDFSIKGIGYSIELVNAILKKIIDDKIVIETFDELIKIEEIIKKIDKTERYEIIGANALYALEAALLKAASAKQGKELYEFLSSSELKILPKPLGNIIGGGVHVKKDYKTDFQEFLVMPETRHFFDAYFINLQAYKIAKQLILTKDELYYDSLTDENALAPSLSNESVLRILCEIRNEILHKFEVKLKVGIDIAASVLWRASKYCYSNKEKKLDSEEQASYITNIIRDYQLNYIEDPLHEDDFNGFSTLLKNIKKSNLDCFIVGDDLTATNLERIKKAIDKKAINAVILKPNQNGSLLEFKKILDFVKKREIIPIISHRSAETYDNTIAHLAVGWQIPIIKTGVLGKERFAKLHEILNIERSLAKNQNDKI